MILDLGSLNFGHKKSLKNEAFLSGRQDSNLRPSGPKPDALPACATPRFYDACRLNGATPTGFEPVTYCLEGSCSIQLSYEVIVKRNAKVDFLFEIASVIGINILQ